jgi:hypothetical protein
VPSAVLPEQRIECCNRLAGGNLDGGMACGFSVHDCSGGFGTIESGF